MKCDVSGITRGPLFIWIDDVVSDPHWRRKPKEGVPARKYRKVPRHCYPPSNAVWLAPKCGSLSPDGRSWCMDNVYDICPECGSDPVPYEPVWTMMVPEKWRTISR